MGKNLQQQVSGLSLTNHGPKCMSGIFHHLNHYRWNTVKKCLPYKRRASSKHGAAVVEDPENKATTSSTSETTQERADAKTENSPVEAKTAEPGSSAPKSMKSRLKALITEEVSKRRGKGRHRRSSSYPTQTPIDEQNAPINIHPDPLNVNPSLESSSVIGKTSDHHNNVHITSLASLLDPPLPKILDGQVTHNHACDMCAVMHKRNHLEQSEICVHGMHGYEDHTLLQNKLIYANEPTKTASLHESKLFLKALDLLNMRKEVFLKILQDPSSSLVHHLHDRQAACKVRSGLGKSMTFPSPGGSLPRGPVKSTEGETIKEKLRVMNEGRLCTDPELLDNATRHSPNEKKRHGSLHGLKHFKNLRDKLKYAIKESRKERHRIVMDAVLDKIPRGRRMPEDTSSSHFNSPFGKNEMAQGMKRAPSFHESPERYNQLLEMCFHRESQHHHESDKHVYRASEAPLPAMRSPKAVLERVLSLPDLRCYYSFRSEDSQCDSFSVRTTTNYNAGSSSGRYGEQNNKVIYTPSGSEYHTISEANSDEMNNAHQADGFLDVGETFDGNIVESTTLDSVPEDMNLQDTTTCNEKFSTAEGDVFAGQPNNESKTETSSLSDSSDDPEKEGSPSPVNGVNNILMHLHVDNKNKAQFDYVKDVLELSGFSGIKFLESWHSAELPLNPSVFEEVEGCLPSQPDCTGNEAGGTCDHLLLFDLINDVLLDMYEKSFSYWPKSLTCHSYIHKMPVGYCVLEQVWANINWLLSWSHDLEQSLDDAVCRDLARGNNFWMNLQYDAECVGLELEELVLDDLLDELIFDDLLS